MPIIKFDDERLYGSESDRRQIFLIRSATNLMMVWMPVMMFMAYVGPGMRSLMDSYTKRLDSESASLLKLPELQRQLDNLQKQTSILTNDSMDARLKTVEQAMKVGGLKADEVASLQSVSSDLSVLKSYMLADPNRLIELKQLQHDYIEVQKKIDTFATKETLQRDVSFWNNVYFISMGLIAILLGGNYLSGRKTSKQWSETSDQAPPNAKS